MVLCTTLDIVNTFNSGAPPMQTTKRGLLAVIVTTGYFWLDAPPPRKEHCWGYKKCSGAPISLERRESYLIPLHLNLVQVF